MWTPECKRLIFGGLGGGRRIGSPKPKALTFDFFLTLTLLLYAMVRRPI